MQYRVVRRVVEDQPDLVRAGRGSEREALQRCRDVRGKIDVPKRDDIDAGGRLRHHQVVGIVAELVGRNTGSVDQAVGGANAKGLAWAIRGDEIEDPGDGERLSYFQSLGQVCGVDVGAHS